jgi:hypothetical protein
VLFPVIDSLPKNTFLVVKLAFKLVNVNRLRPHIGDLIGSQTTERTILSRKESDPGASMLDLLKGDIQRAARLGQFNNHSRDLYIFVRNTEYRAILTGLTFVRQSA